MFRTSGVELRRSIMRYFLNVALKHVLVIDMIGDLNSSPFNRRRPVKRMKYSISHECRVTETLFMKQYCVGVDKNTYAFYRSS